MRRTVGISSLERSSITNASYNNLSDSLSAANLAHLQEQLFKFQSSLKSFAIKHGNKIKSDPEFRSTFAEMCNELGVDPLSNGRKGFWDWIGFGDWTYELAVQVVDVCLRTRDRNGGLHEIQDIIKAVRSLRDMPVPERLSQLDISDQKKKKTGLINVSLPNFLQTTISEGDIFRAIKCLEPLGSGYSVIDIGTKKFVRSVPAELDSDSLALFDSILSSKNSTGYTTHRILQDHTGWSSIRVKHSIEKAVMMDAMLWIDAQADGGDESERFYAPSLFRFDDMVI